MWIDQKCKPGTIKINSSVLLPKSSEYNHKDTTFTYDRIKSNLTAVLDGEITGTVEFRTYEGKEYAVITADTNTTGRDLTGTLIISGIDYNGDEIVDSVPITQTADDPYVEFDPWVWVGTEFINIPYNELYTSFTLHCNRIVSIEDVTASALINPTQNTWNIQGYTLVKLDDGYTLTIQTEMNNTHTPTGKYPLRVVATTEYGKNPWESAYKLGEKSMVFIRKCGIPGILYLEPSYRLVTGEAGSTYYTYTADRWMGNTFSISHTGDMNITGFVLSGDKILIDYGENRTPNIKREEITISGIDYQGLTITSTVILEQEQLSYIEFVDKVKTIGPTESVVQFRIEDFGVTDINFSFNGNVNITNSVLSLAPNGHILTLTTADNPNYVVLHTTITVTARNNKGKLLMDTAELYKNGPDGEIILTPSRRYGGPEPFVASFDQETKGMSTLDRYVSSGVLEILNAYIGNPTTFSIGRSPLDAVNWNDSQKVEVNVVGTDYKGKEILSNTVVITQYAIDPTITISPEEATIGFEGGNLEFSVVVTGPILEPVVNLNGTYS